MRGRGRALSPREQGLVDGFIGDICGLLRIPAGKGDLYQCAWAAFLSVYRDDPAAFSGAGRYGWKRAYLMIREALVRERRESGFWRCGRISLDQPVNGESETRRIELLPARCGDFQNSVCFHDYLRRLDRDACRMAYRLIDGDSVEEVRAYYDWSCDYADSTYRRLQAEMERYLRI